MAAHTLTVRPLRRERDLQTLISSWASPPPSWTIVAPEWFRRLPSPRRRGRFATSLGYEFEPDAIFDTATETIVAELKLSPQGKYESLALPEVLHHVWMLRHDPVARPAERKPITPLILTPFNSWLIASIRLLAEECALAPQALRVLAFDAFEHEGRRLFWASDPFTPWTASAAPPDVLRMEFPDFHWYRVADEGSWFGLREPHDERPAFVTCQHVEAAALPETGEFIACVGDYETRRWEYRLLR